MYEAGEGNRPLFKAFLNGKEYSSEIAQGTRVGNEIVLTATNGDGQITINLADFAPGEYLGEDNTSNQIRFTSSTGGQFASDRPNEKSDAKIRITFYNEDESTISGRFSGKLYDFNFVEDKFLTNGVFNDLPIDVPFQGRMSAQIENKRFSADQCYYSSSVSGGDTTDRITAISVDDSSRIFIEIDEKIEIGNYEIGDAEATVIYNANVFSANQQENQYFGEEGNFVVSEIDSVKNRIRGAFNVEVRNAAGESLIIQSGEYTALW